MNSKFYPYNIPSVAQMHPGLISVAPGLQGINTANDAGAEVDLLGVEKAENTVVSLLEAHSKQLLLFHRLTLTNNM
jgi:hypothetical protein